MAAPKFKFMSFVEKTEGLKAKDEVPEPSLVEATTLGAAALEATALEAAALVATAFS